jgi:hypothetical protein
MLRDSTKLGALALLPCFALRSQFDCHSLRVYEPPVFTGIVCAHTKRNRPVHI